MDNSERIDVESFIDQRFEDVQKIINQMSVAAKLRSGIIKKQDEQIKMLKSYIYKITGDEYFKPKDS